MPTYYNWFDPQTEPFFFCVRLTYPSPIDTTCIHRMCTYMNAVCEQALCAHTLTLNQRAERFLNGLALHFIAPLFFIYLFWLDWIICSVVFFCADYTSAFVSQTTHKRWCVYDSINVRPYFYFFFCWVAAAVVIVVAFGWMCEWDWLISQHFCLVVPDCMLSTLSISYYCVRIYNGMRDRLRTHANDHNNDDQCMMYVADLKQQQ